MKSRPIKSNRSGFALMLVLVFVVLFLAMVGVTLRETATALRVESVRTLQSQRDEGSLNALAKGLALLETGSPPSSPYVCGTSIVTSTGTRSYTVTFTSEGGINWSVNSVQTPSGSTPTAMPVTFASY